MTSLFDYKNFSQLLIFVNGDKIYMMFVSNLATGD